MSKSFGVKKKSIWRNKASWELLMRASRRCSRLRCFTTNHRRESGAAHSRRGRATYKLKLNGGDIKAVQGDSGHAQAKMVTDQYSHILDESRVLNAHLLEEAFYGRRGSEASMVTHPASEKKADPVVQQLEASGMDAAALVQILSNPEMVNMSKMLSKTLVGNKE